MAEQPSKVFEPRSVILRRSKKKRPRNTFRHRTLAIIAITFPLDDARLPAATIRERGCFSSSRYTICTEPSIRFTLSLSLSLSLSHTHAHTYTHAHTRRHECARVQHEQKTRRPLVPCRVVSCRVVSCRVIARNCREETRTWKRREREAGKKKKKETIYTGRYVCNSKR